MTLLFYICLLGFISTIPPYYLSLEHLKLEKKYGKEKGKTIGKISGAISGWAFFLFWFGIWLSPQPRFTIPFLQDLLFRILVIDLTIPLLHLLIFVPFFMLGAWFGIKGVVETTLEVAETHRPTRVVTTGVYSIVRHPQYLGGLLAHVAFTFIFSALYSLLITPLIAGIVYLLSRKEEEELTKEFGEEYIRYKKKVPMFLPKLKAPRASN